MPGLAIMGGSEEVPNGGHSSNNNNNGDFSPNKSILGFSQQQKSPRSTLSQRSSDSIDLAMDGVIDTSIEQLYHNVCEMQCSDPSPSRGSFLSYGEESRIDSELCHLIGIPNMKEITKEVFVVAENNTEEEQEQEEIIREVNSAAIDQNANSGKERRVYNQQTESSRKKRASPRRPLPNGTSPFRSPRRLASSVAETVAANNGPLLLKQARDMISSGENPRRALVYALKAAKAFEPSSNETPNLEHVMSLHVLAAIHCSLGNYNEAIPVLEKSIQIPAIYLGLDHALAKFAGCMQLGDTYAMLGQVENSILCYTAGLEIQKQSLGDKDPRVGETCRYLAEAHVQALQFDEAANVCQMALDIHRGPEEEAADRKLMGLICEARGDYESALEHYVLASMSMAANGREVEVASVDCSIGDAYLSLSRYDEAVFAYQKALATFKSKKGESSTSVASVLVKLGNLYNKIGKFKESKTQCQNALKIYESRPNSHQVEEVASGFIDIAAIYQSMDELDQAIRLLRKALKVYGDDVPGQQSTVAGIEAQIGVMHYMMGEFSESYNSFKSAVSKMRASGEKKSAMFGIALNQMGLACVQRYAINEAAELFEEARGVLEKEYGAYHADTLAVYSNLAGTYDAMGRLDDAIEILDQVVRMREQKLGTANPEVVDEKRRLAELLKEAGRARNRKSIALLSFLDTEVQSKKNEGIEVA
ncbi:unnamed protein product [Linum tenue]|uniref:Kinesin light chain n=3 Tax=Linum TaxID=4005 RepID=A0AAV0N9X2_9ROSI|nr:unnamed protein product [Linum tenue]